MTDTAALKLELLIANATDAARNPYADTFVNAAVGNLIEALIKNQPPAFEYQLHPVVGSFDEAASYLKKLAYAFDLVVEKISREAGLIAPTTISERSSIFSDALHDSDLLAELDDAAERVREDVMEDA